MDRYIEVDQDIYQDYRDQELIEMYEAMEYAEHAADLDAEFYGRM